MNSSPSGMATLSVLMPMQQAPQCETRVMLAADPLSGPKA